MADAPAPPPPPVAIRITRPQTTEDEFLERELETLSRASITLLGAHPRPHGVVLRFELCLATGAVLVRGEGRVVGFKANAFEGLGGLTLRFTRLDSRSKALIDRASALRELRRPSTRPPQAPGASMAPPPVEPTPPGTVPPIPMPEPSSPLPIAAMSEPRLPPPSAPSSRDASPVPPAVAPAPFRLPAATSERETLLERLRIRAKSLDPVAVQQLLARRRA